VACACGGFALIVHTSQFVYTKCKKAVTSRRLSEAVVYTKPENNVHTLCALSEVARSRGGEDACGETEGLTVYVTSCRSLREPADTQEGAVPHQGRPGSLHRGGGERDEAENVTHSNVTKKSA
jgi:hypothetical protein